MINTLTKDLDLTPGVVDVVLAGDVVAAGFKQASQGIANDAAAAGAGGERTRGIGAYILHLHARVPSDIGPPIPGAGLDDGLQLFQNPGVVDPEVDEPRSGRFDAT